ncbi:MAG: SPOR domain-containing protein [Nitrospinota bacterium]|nr:SPOR domain-containing protein [Nitrospinota bacterium]
MKRNTRKDSFLSVTFTKSKFAVCIATFLFLLSAFFSFGHWIGKNKERGFLDEKKKNSNRKEIYLLKKGTRKNLLQKDVKRDLRIKKEFYNTLNEDRQDDSFESSRIKSNLNEKSSVKNSKTISLKKTNNLQGLDKPLTRHKKDISKGRYSLQIASFKKIVLANDITRKLKYKGFSAYVEFVDLGKRGKWYRVRIDVPSAKGSLDRLRKKLKKDLKISKFQIIKN